MIGQTRIVTHWEPQVTRLQRVNGGADETRTRDLRRDRPAF